MHGKEKEKTILEYYRRKFLEQYPPLLSPKVPSYDLTANLNILVRYPRRNWVLAVVGSKKTGDLTSIAQKNIFVIQRMELKKLASRHRPIYWERMIVYTPRDEKSMIEAALREYVDIIHLDPRYQKVNEKNEEKRKKKRGKRKGKKQEKTGYLTNKAIKNIKRHKKVIEVDITPILKMGKIGYPTIWGEIRDQTLERFLSRWIRGIQKLIRNARVMNVPMVFSTPNCSHTFTNEEKAKMLHALRITPEDITRGIDVLRWRLFQKRIVSEENMPFGMVKRD